jgi:hypothetical protein
MTVAAGESLYWSGSDCCLNELHAEIERLRKAADGADALRARLDRYRGSLTALRALMNARPRTITERDVARWIDDLLIT